MDKMKKRSSMERRKWLVENRAAVLKALDRLSKRVINLEENARRDSETSLALEKKVIDLLTRPIVIQEDSDFLKGLRQRVQRWDLAAESQLSCSCKPSRPPVL
jgi:hypothetical protein